MAKKRRKLNKDYEKKIYAANKSVELVLAKIYDISDEDIQKEYFSAFNKVVFLYDQLKGDYDQQQIRPLRICSGQQLRDRSELNRWMQPP